MTALIPAGVSVRSYAATIAWARRRDRFGVSGATPEGAAARAQNLASTWEQARIRARSRRTCRQGHVYTVIASRRYCGVCRRLRRHQARRLQLAQQHLARLKAAMIALHPDRGGSARRFRKAYRLWLTARSAHGR